MVDSTMAASRPLSLPEVAAMTGTCEATLRYWRHLSSAGKPTGPTSYKIGRRVVYDGAAVAAWLNEQRGQGGAQSA